MNSSTPRPSVWPKVFLAVLHALQVLSLLPWIMMAGLSVMAFDAPGSEQTWQPWLLVGLVWTYPLWILAAAVVSWILILRHRAILALCIAAFFSLPLVAGVVLLTR